MTGTEYSAVWRGAEALLHELMIKWPDQRWRIEADIWPGGSEIKVCWVGGPEERAVSEIARRFEFPHIPGPADLYMTREVPGGGAKFVTLHRE